MSRSRAATAIAFAIIAAMAAGTPAAPPGAGSQSARVVVTRELPPAAIKQLIGCWRGRRSREVWVFRRHGPRGVEVVRDIGDVPYKARVRVPAAVVFEPANDIYALAAAGRLHGLIAVFRLEPAALRVSWWTNHDDKLYYPTGARDWLVRCRGARGRRE